MDDLRNAVSAATSFEQASQAAINHAVDWDSVPLGQFMGDGLQLAALMGRDAVFREVDGETDTDFFADAESFGQPFKEQIEFFEQKNTRPTRRWTDAMRGTHDRAFVVAGAADDDMLKDFQNSLLKSMKEGTTFAEFQNDFDTIVAKYGWEFNGERQRRARTIFETNMRTSYAAGRLAQMRDPDVLALRPFWQYKHGVTRKPKIPRERHKGWDGTVLPHDDPFWDTNYPPNGWKCSCGVVTLSQRDLERDGKTGPDASPILGREPFIDPVTGKLGEKVQHVDYGFDYQPGDLWERGLVPSNIIREAGGVTKQGRGLIATIDEPRPLQELIDDAVPFETDVLEDGLDEEAYLAAFLDEFGATPGQAIRFVDKDGTSIPISAELFRERGGDLKVTKRGRETFVRQIAETIKDPDEIWLGVREVKVPNFKATEIVVDRRYIRVDQNTGLIVVFQIGSDGWEEITAFPQSQRGKLNVSGLQARRHGKLVYERKE